jgi:hypothetical protein
MRKGLTYYISFLFIISLACTKDIESETSCGQGLNYLTFETAKANECFGMCSATTASYTRNSETVHSTTIFATVETEPMKVITIVFPDNSTGVYNNSDIDGLNYYCSFESDLSSYSFPSNITGLQGNEFFKLSITEFDLGNNRISGSFSGKIYSSEQQDSLEINNGLFECTLTTSEH